MPEAASGKALVIHSLEQARVALAAARETGVPVTLFSAEAAAGGVGPGWFFEVIAQATAEYPEVQVEAVFDCGDHPGWVMAALRRGLKRVRYSGPRPMAKRLSAIAAAHEGTLLTGRPPALDLLDRADSGTLCRRWLAPE